MFVLPYSKPWEYLLHWTILYFVNLGAAGIIGSSELHSEYGWYGAGLSIALFYALTTVAIAASRPLREVMIEGSSWLALTQLYPIIQLIAGIVAFLTVVFTLGAVRPTAEPWEACAEGFLLTMITGQILFVVAFLIGGGHRLIRTWIVGIVTSHESSS